MKIPLENITGLGEPVRPDYKNLINDIINSKILHWTGKFKPWLKNGSFKGLWEKYKLEIE